MPLSHQERQFFQEQDLPQQCCFINNMSGARGGERGGQLAHCIAPASSLLGFREAKGEGRWCWSNRAIQGLICKSSTALTTAKVQERPWYVQEPQWAPGLEGSLPLPCSPWSCPAPRQGPCLTSLTMVTPSTKTVPRYFSSRRDEPAVFPQ